MSRSPGRGPAAPAGPSDPSCPEPSDPGDPGKPRKERRLARHARHARTIWREPAAAGPLLRNGMIAIWRSRGGGLYGFGYLVTFVALEVRLVVSEFDTSAGLFDFLGNQFLEYLFRLGFMSLVNMLLAFIWPLLVIERFQLWGIVALGLGYFVFERWLRRAIEAQIPELKPPPGKRRGRRRAAAAEDDAGGAGPPPH